MLVAVERLQSTAEWPLLLARSTQRSLQGSVDGCATKFNAALCSQRREPHGICCCRVPPAGKIPHQGLLGMSKRAHVPTSRP